MVPAENFIVIPEYGLQKFVETGREMQELYLRTEEHVIKSKGISEYGKSE